MNNKRRKCGVRAFDHNLLALHKIENIYAAPLLPARVVVDSVVFIASQFAYGTGAVGLLDLSSGWPRDEDSQTGMVIENKLDRQHERVNSVKEIDEASQRYRAPALEKGLEILELLAREGVPRTTRHISKALGRSVSELFRMLQVLQFKGYIVDSGEGYHLSGKLFTMGLSSAPLTSLTDEALPHMRTFARRVRQSCHLAVQSDEQIVVIARVENPEYFGYSVRSGHRLDITRSTSGVVLYAFQPPEIQTKLAQQIRARHRGGLSQTFLAKVKAARRQGYWSANSDLVPSVVDIATPIFQSGSVVASLTVPYIHQIHTIPVEKVIVQAQLTAAAISETLARNL